MSSLSSDSPMSYCTEYSATSDELLAEECSEPVMEYNEEQDKNGGYHGNITLYGNEGYNCNSCCEPAATPVHKYGDTLVIGKTTLLSY